SSFTRELVRSPLRARACASLHIRARRCATSARRHGVVAPGTTPGRLARLRWRAPGTRTSPARTVMNFLEKIFRNLRDSPALAKIIEIHLTTPRGTDGHGLLELIGRARGWLHAQGVRPGDRVASLAPNSV